MESRSGNPATFADFVAASVRAGTMLDASVDPLTGHKKITLRGARWEEAQKAALLAGLPRKERWRMVWASDEFQRAYDDGESDGVSQNQRFRDLAQLDWSTCPKDWPRDKWPAWAKNPECLEPNLLGGAADRIRKALQNARKTLA